MLAVKVDVSSVMTEYTINRYETLPQVDKQMYGCARDGSQGEDPRRDDLQDPATACLRRARVRAPGRITADE